MFDSQLFLPSNWPDSEMLGVEENVDEFVLDVVEVEHSDTERRLDNADKTFNCSSLRLK